jgi:Protein of unknown function (DUF664)
VVLSTDDYVWFVNRKLDQMVDVLHQLGDDHVCERPDLPGANSPYGIVTHCLGVMTSWAGHLVAGREVVRDRETEFHATGDIESLVTKIGAAKVQFRADADAAQFDDALRDAVAPSDAALPFGQRQGAALVHIFEELTQHLGQMEITRDVLLAEG